MEGDRPIKALIDLDGTLICWSKRACEILNVDHLYDNPANHGKAHVEKIVGVPKDEFYRKLGYDFWSNLPFLPDAHDLISLVEKHFSPKNIVILTKLVENPGCAQGKLDWVKKNLPKYYSQTTLCVGYIKDKFASDKHVLIDDNDLNVQDFWTEGGKAFLIPRPWNSGHKDLNYLEKLDKCLRRWQSDYISSHSCCC